MWPKAIAQLVELLPHAARLLPVADRFFQSKAAGEEANRKALEAMAEGLRGDLGQVTAVHSGLYRQLNEQADRLAEVSTEVRAARAAAEAAQMRSENLERRLDRMAGLLLLISILLLAALVMLGFLLARHA